MKVLKYQVRSIRVGVMAAGVEPEVVDETKNHKREKDLDATKKKQHLKRSRSSKSLNSKKKSSCSTKAMCTLLLTVVCLVGLGIGAFYLYKLLSRHTCNAFGISYPRSCPFSDFITFRPAGVGSSGHLREAVFHHHFRR